jgi:protein-L-isoaspartate(D-aspartate) O-methyltransferase
VSQAGRRPRAPQAGATPSRAEAPRAEPVRADAPRFPASLPAAGAPARVPGPRDGTLVRPQQLLHQAARDAVRRPVPSGLGLDSQAVRERMVRRLHGDGVRHPGVLDAFSRVPRHLFVDSALAIQAYEDTSLPIGLGQTISKPSVVARMLELALGAPGRGASLGRVLEIGTGCGYQAALLALISRELVSIERLGALHAKALRHLQLAGVEGVHLLHGDGCLGHAPRAPYDTIIAAAGGDSLPEAWLQQLAPGGRLVAPMRAPGRQAQVLVVVDRTAEGLRRSEHEGVLFVPLKTGAA